MVEIRKNTGESVRLEAMVIGKTCTQDWINGVNALMQECVQQQSTNNNIVHVLVRSTEAKNYDTKNSYVHNACTLSIWKHHRYNIYNNDMYKQLYVKCTLSKAQVLSQWLVQELTK